MSEKEYVFGIRAVIEAIKSGKEIERLLIKKGLKGELFGELFALIRELEIPFQHVPIEKINRITQKNHQGVVAYLSAITYHSIENIIPMVFEKGENPLILVLDRVTDVRNFGAIARTAECSGVHAIMIPNKGAAQINSDALKTSAGALHNIPVCRVNSLKDGISFLKKSGLQIFAVSEKSEDDYFKSDFSTPTAFIMGAEDKGIALELIHEADKNIRIPILGDIDSLNVSVATGIILYESVKQRLTQ